MTETVICHSCQTPISGMVAKYGGEPVHPSCMREERERLDLDGGQS